MRQNNKDFFFHEKEGVVYNLSLEKESKLRYLGGRRNLVLNYIHFDGSKFFQKHSFIKI